jgi:hypothetical protein
MQGYAMEVVMSIRIGCLRAALLVCALHTVEAAAQGVQRGSVTGLITDSAGVALSQADISFPALAVWVHSGERGEFAIANIPAGPQKIVVRRIGYAPLELSVAIAEGPNVLEPFRLARIVTLDTIVTRSSYRDPTMEEFAEHRAMGLGHFLTAAQLSAQRGAFLGSHLREISGLLVVSTGGKDWVGTKRGMITSCRNTPSRVPAGGVAFLTALCLQSEGLYYVPEDAGAPIMCFARVFMDDRLMNPGLPTPPFDLRTISTADVQAVEWYARGSEMPAKYLARNANCGVLVLRTRRS